MQTGGSDPFLPGGILRDRFESRELRNCALPLSLCCLDSGEFFNHLSCFRTSPLWSLSLVTYSPPTLFPQAVQFVTHSTLSCLTNNRGSGFYLLIAV